VDAPCAAKLHLHDGLAVVPLQGQRHLPNERAVSAGYTRASIAQRVGAPSRKNLRWIPRMPPNRIITCNTKRMPAMLAATSREHAGSASASHRVAASHPAHLQQVAAIHALALEQRLKDEVALVGGDEQLLRRHGAAAKVAQKPREEASERARLI